MIFFGRNPFTEIMIVNNKPRHQISLLMVVASIEAQLERQQQRQQRAAALAMFGTACARPRAKIQNPTRHWRELSQMSRIKIAGGGWTKTVDGTGGKSQMLLLLCTSIDHVLSQIATLVQSPRGEPFQG